MSSDSRDAAERAYEAVLERIYDGRLAAGARLPEQALAADIGVSRTPVREAVRRLAAEGMVDVVPNRGAQVVSVTEKDNRELYTLRAELEPVAARLAVERMDASDLARLLDLHERMLDIVGSGHDRAELTSLNNAFHTLFIERCGNRHLGLAIGALMRPVLVTRTFRAYDHDSLLRSMRYHGDLITAARVRDGEWAEAVMRAHILSARHVGDDVPTGADNDVPAER
ncbi:GntR family transcriptional regulator [Flexivirga lutea]